MRGPIDQNFSEAQQSPLPARVDEVAKKMCTFVELAVPVKENDETDRKTTASVDSSSLLNSTNCSTDVFEEGIAHRDRCGKNSLAQLCRRFLMVLLCKARDICIFQFCQKAIENEYAKYPIKIDQK